MTPKYRNVRAIIHVAHLRTLPSATGQNSHIGQAMPPWSLSFEFRALKKRSLRNSALGPTNVSQSSTLVRESTRTRQSNLYFSKQIVLRALDSTLGQRFSLQRKQMFQGNHGSVQKLGVGGVALRVASGGSVNFRLRNFRLIICEKKTENRRWDSWQGTGVLIEHWSRTKSG